MTAAELKNYFRTILVAQRTISQEYNVLDAVVDFITQALTSGIPDWTNALTFNTDGTGNGSFCVYPDTNDKIRFWKTKTDANIGNSPPTNPVTTEDANWIEVSPSDGSAIKEWSAGFYGEGLVIVFYNDGVERSLYQLIEPTRPYNSADIAAEIIAGDWVKIARPATPLESFTIGNLNQLFTATLGGDELVNPAIVFTPVNKAMNLFLAGPIAGADAAPTFRAINDADGVVIKEDATNVLNTTYKAGTVTKPPFKLTAGSNLTVPVNGAVEFDGTHLYITIAGVRLQLDSQAILGTDFENGITSTDKARLGGALTIDTTISGAFKLLLSMNQLLIQKNFGLHAAAPSFEEGVGISYRGAATTPPTTPPTAGIFEWVAAIDGVYKKHMMDTEGNITVL